MKFAIATVDFWESVGFNTLNWRKSTDGKYALVHLEYAKILINENDKNIKIYTANTLEFNELLNSELWSEQEKSGDVIG